jgi:hypothetical protein
MNGNEIILQLSAEGGGLTLYGHRTINGWWFSRHVLDWTPELLNEPCIEHHSDVARTWPEALELLDCYPWHLLRPTRVHPEFRKALLDAATARCTVGDGQKDTPKLSKWMQACAEQQ